MRVRPCRGPGSFLLAINDSFFYTTYKIGSQKGEVLWKKYCVGVDVGGTTVKLGLFQTDGKLIFKWEIPTRKEDSGKYILEDVSVAVREVLRERQIHLEQVVGVGLGVPGPVLPDGQVERCVNLGWHNVNPQSQLSSFLDGILVKSGNV